HVHRPQAHLALVDAREEELLAVGGPRQVLEEVADLRDADGAAITVLSARDARHSDGDENSEAPASARGGSRHTVAVVMDCRDSVDPVFRNYHVAMGAAMQISAYPRGAKRF